MSAAAGRPGRATTIARIVLIAGGVGLLGIGGLVLLLDVSPKRYAGIALWFVGAIIVHDAVIAPAVFGVGVVLRRLGRRMPGAVLVILQSAIVLVAIVTAIVVPEILKQDIGSANPTILPLDYAGNLVVLYLVVGLLTLAAITIYIVVKAGIDSRQRRADRRDAEATRENDRPAISHD